jgi:hypothetical protein
VERRAQRDRKFSRRWWKKNAVPKMRERRKHERLPISSPARVLDAGNLLSRCQLVDISPTGACIALDPTVPLQERFHLFSRHLERECRMVWRAGERLGAEFV